MSRAVCQGDGGQQPRPPDTLMAEPGQWRSRASDGRAQAEIVARGLCFGWRRGKATAVRGNATWKERYSLNKDKRSRIT